MPATKHNHQLVFGRRRWRCDEPLRIRDIRASGCAPICTFGDW